MRMKVKYRKQRRPMNRLWSKLLKLRKTNAKQEDERETVKDERQTVKDKSETENMNTKLREINMKLTKMNVKLRK